MKISMSSGLWAPEDKNGLVKFGTELSSLGHDVTLHNWDDEPDPQANVLIAHSYAATTAMKMIRKNPGRFFSLVVFLDGVKRPWGWFSFTEWDIPINIQNAIAFYRGAILPPWSSKIKNVSPRRTNFYVNLGHADIPGNVDVQKEIKFQIKQIGG